MKKLFLLVGLVAFAVVFSGCTQTQVPATFSSCTEWRQSGTPEPELSFITAYCNGDFCNGATKEECESTSNDFVSEADITKSNPDGKSDCKWVENAPGRKCQANK